MRLEQRCWTFPRLIPDSALRLCASAVNLQSCVQKIGPKPAGEFPGIVLGGEFVAIAPDVFDVAGEQLIGAGVFAGIDGLGEVDDDRLVFPIENVEGGEVAVDSVVGEEEMDVAADALIDVIGLP